MSLMYFGYSNMIVISQNMPGGKIKDLLEQEMALRRFKKFKRSLSQELAADHGQKIKASFKK